VLVHDFVDVDVAFDEVVSILTDAGDEMGIWASAAFRRGEKLTLGPGEAASAPISLEIGAPLVGTDVVTIPMSWIAASGSRLFPRMDAEVVIAPLGPSATHLEFRGSYRPPMEGFGEFLDRIAFHHVAESTVHGFMERVASALVVESRSTD